MKIFTRLQRFLALAILIAAAAPAHAQATPESLAEEVLMAYEKGDVAKFGELVTASPLLDKSATLSAQINTNVRTLLDVYGPVEGWELIKSKSASDRFRENSYIIFQREFATRLTLSFYKRSTGWITTSFNIDDSASKLLVEQDWPS
ncbi:MAG: hypothetical protein AAF067_00550 [Pseudomonadota bacterium]